MLLMGLVQQRPELTSLFRVQGQRVLQMLLVLGWRQLGRLRSLRGFGGRAAAPGGWLRQRALRIQLRRLGGRLGPHRQRGRQGEQQGQGQRGEAA